MYSAIDLSKYIITKCVEDGFPVSNLQLQKILYFIQREFLQKTGDYIFTDNIEAWQFGPVVPNVYYEFYGYGASPIVELYNDKNISSDDEEVINPIVETRRSQQPWELVDETHKTHGAWHQVYRNGQGNRQVIPVMTIRNFG